MNDDEELIDEDLTVPTKNKRAIMPIERLMSEDDEDDS